MSWKVSTYLDTLTARAQYSKDMSDFNSQQHGEYHRGNRGGRRYWGRRPYRARVNGARGQFHQTSAPENTARGAEAGFDFANDARGQFHQSWAPENTARGAQAGFDFANDARGQFHQSWAPENTARGAEAGFDFASEGGIGGRSENQRSQGRQRPRGRGRPWRRGRGEGFMTSDVPPLFAEESFVEQSDARGAEDGFDFASKGGSGDRSENQRNQGRQRPRGRGKRGRRGRGEGLTTSESFVEQSDDSDENSPTAQGKSTSEQKVGSEHGSSSATSNSEQKTKVPAPDRSVRVDHNRILHYLVNSHNGSCLVSDLRENHTLFEASLMPNAVVQALKQCKKIKVLTNGNNLDGSVVKAFIKSLRLCFQYKPPKLCPNKKCRHLHLCRDFVVDCCFMKHCVCSHNVESEWNVVIMNDCGVQIFSPDQQLSLIRCTNLMVCREHNSSEGCPDPDSCFKLHICNAYVINKCLLMEDQCAEGHDPFSERNKKVLQLHEMDKLPKETIFKMLLAFRKQPQRNTKYAGNCSEAQEVKPTNIQRQRRSVVEHEVDETTIKVPYEAARAETKEVKATIIYRRPEFEHEEDETRMKVPCEAAPVQPPATRSTNLMSFTEFMQRNIDSSMVYHEESKDICDTFEEHSCNLKENCTDRHKSRTPYLWRVKLNGQWISLEKENSAIERAFSYSDIDEYWAMESIPGMPLRLNFKDMTSDCGPIQRLSTPSDVEIRDKVDATRWLWYWHDGSQWIPYGQSGEPPHLDILEAKYQRDPKLICCFEFGSTLYELDFVKMEQKNLRTHYVRKVTRRPLYEERVGLSAYRRLDDEYHCDVSKLPIDWVPMDTESKDGTELVPLHSKADAYQTVSTAFFKTMEKTNQQIRRIYKVQNLELWNNYEAKKTSIDKHMGGETEVHVFHGTAEEETTRWICGVGFDQRMHGVNGTVYGKGAYFATTAKYSHGYTQPSSRKFRYMFYAKITIGRVAKGDSSLKRPPAIDPGNPKKGLYDSCANSVTDPSIYVIFDNSQTYPDYLIEYRDIHPDPVLDQSSLSQSQAYQYAQAFNRSAAYATTSPPTNIFQSSAQNPPPSHSIPSYSPPSNPPPSNPPPSNPPPSNPSPSNPPRPTPTYSQHYSTKSQASKPSSCLVM